MTTYFVTGVTGKLGRAALTTLLANGVAASDIVVGVRDLARASEFEALGVTVRQTDFTQPATLATAFAGVDKLLLVSSQPSETYSRLAQHKNVIDAAKNAGVSLIVYTSLADVKNSDLMLAPDHLATEQYLAQSGVTFAVVRNNWYLENELDAIKAGDFTYETGDAKIGWALIREYGEGAAKVLLADNVRQVYEFSGALHTYAELAAAVQRVSDQNVSIKAISLAEFSASLSASGAPSGVVDFVTALQAGIAAGNLAVASSDLADVLGRPLATLDEAVAELLK